MYFCNHWDIEKRCCKIGSFCKDGRDDDCWEYTPVFDEERNEGEEGENR